MRKSRPARTTGADSAAFPIGTQWRAACGNKKGPPERAFQLVD
jgi:hypothetical protein